MDEWIVEGNDVMAACLYGLYTGAQRVGLSLT